MRRLCYLVCGIWKLLLFESPFVVPLGCVDDDDHTLVFLIALLDSCCVACACENEDFVCAAAALVSN